MSTFAEPPPRPRTFNTFRSLMCAVRSPFSSKSCSRTSTSSTKHFNGRKIGSPHPDDETLAIASHLAVDLNTAQHNFKARSTPYRPEPPSSSNSTRTFASNSGSWRPFDAVSDSSVSVYSQPSSLPKPQGRLYYHTTFPPNTPVTESRTPPRQAPPQTPARSQRAPVPLPPIFRQPQAQLLNHPPSISPPSPRPPSYSRPTPAAYPDLATSRSRHQSLPSTSRRSVALPKPAPPPNTPLPPIPKTAPPPRPPRSPARPATAGNDRRPQLHATVSTEGDIFTLRRNATLVASATPCPRPARPRTGSSIVYF
jgi:hypothetical protein